MHRHHIPQTLIVKVDVFSKCLEWNVYVHSKQSCYERWWHENDRQNTEDRHDFVFYLKVHEGLFNSSHCTLDRMAVVRYAVNHKLKHNLLLLIIRKLHFQIF